jgi:cytidylate kinase
MQSTREQILSAIPKVGSSVFVAIDGHGGSGKSTLAELLGTQLGATVVH